MQHFLQGSALLVDGYELPQDGQCAGMCFEALTSCRLQMARREVRLLQQLTDALRLAPPSAVLVDPQRRLVTCLCLPLK